MLVNYLDNALKFTPAGQVRVAVTERSDAGALPSLEFSVEDSGVGFAETQRHRLFQMQFSFFASRRPLLVWDAPGHGASRPFALDFSLMEQAEWLLLPKAVDDIANGRICVVDGKVKHNK